MNAALLLKVAEVVGTVLGAVAFALMTYWRLRDKRMRRELHIGDNPTECGAHAARLEDLEKDVEDLVKTNREDHRIIYGKLEALGNEIVRLGRNGGRQ